MEPEAAIEPSDLFQKMQEASGMELGACFGCKKCSNGCPLMEFMDLHPYQVVRYAQLGLIDELEACRTIWVCASCQSCFTRCPNEVDLPRFMDQLKHTLHHSGRDVSQGRTLLFHQLFLKEIKARGRVFEASLMARYLLGTAGPFSNEARQQGLLGWTMFKKGRIGLLPHGVKDRRWLKSLFAPEGEDGHATG